MKSVKEEEYIKSVTIYFFLSSFCVCVGIVIICLSVDDENEGWSTKMKERNEEKNNKSWNRSCRVFPLKLKAAAAELTERKYDDHSHRHIRHPYLSVTRKKKKLWCATTKKSEKDRLLLSKLRCMLFFSFLFCRVLLSRFGNNYSLLSVVIKFVRNHFRFANYGAKRCWYGCWRFFICNIMRCVCVSCAYFNWRQNLNLDTKSNEPKLIFKRRVLNNNNSSSQGEKVKFSACCVCECFFPFLFSFAFEVRWYIKMSAPSSVVANI